MPASPSASKPRASTGAKRSAAASDQRALLRTAESPYYQLWVLSNLTAKPFSEIGARFHLNLTQWRVMLTVADHPGITAQALSEYSGLDKMIVSRAVRGLEEQRRLAREGDDADRRLRHLSLTAKGWEVYGRIAIAALAREAEIYSVLGATELAELRRLLAKLSDQARASNSGQTKPYSSAPSSLSLRPGASAQARSVQP